MSDKKPDSKITDKIKSATKSKTNSSGAQTAKSKGQQKKDVAKIGVAAAGAGAVAYAVTKKAVKGKKGKMLAAVFAVIVVVVVAATGLLYYFDVPPLNFELGGNFKYYSLPNVPYTDNDLRIHFMNVGQGDSILIELPDGKNMLIDSGIKDNKITDKIITYIKDLGIDTIHYAMLTHADSDHSGGFAKIIRDPDLTFEKMYQPLLRSSHTSALSKCYVEQLFSEYTADTASMTDANRIPVDANFKAGAIRPIDTLVYADFISAVKDEILAKGGEVIFSYQQQVIKGESGQYSLTFYNPSYAMYRSVSTAQQKNNVSPMVVLEFNGKKILLTGDGDEDAEDNYLINSKDAVGEVDVLKVAHHGGQYSTRKTLLDKADPDFSVISVGKNNYGHPTAETLNRLKGSNSKIFRTDTQGDVVLTVSSQINWKFYKDGKAYNEAGDYIEETSAVIVPVPVYSTAQLTISPCWKP